MFLSLRLLVCLCMSAAVCDRSSVDPVLFLCMYASMDLCERVYVSVSVCVSVSESMCLSVCVSILVCVVVGCLCGRERYRVWFRVLTKLR